MRKRLTRRLWKTPRAYAHAAVARTRSNVAQDASDYVKRLRRMQHSPVLTPSQTANKYAKRILKGHSRTQHNPTQQLITPYHIKCNTIVTENR